MKNSATYIYDTEDPNGSLGSRVGNYYAVSADKRRHYFVYANSKFPYVEFSGVNDFVYYPEEYLEDGLDREFMARLFIISCEEVFNDGHTSVYHEEVARAMMFMSERGCLGWVMEESIDTDDYSPVWNIYAKWFADKAHIGEDVVYCFSEDAIIRTLKENRGAWSTWEMDEVIMQYPDGSHDETEAYIVYLPEEIMVEKDCEEELIEIEEEWEYDDENAWNIIDVNDKVRFSDTDDVEIDIKWDGHIFTIREKVDKVLNAYNHVRQILHMIDMVDDVWKDRNITDATAEPEWEEYENLLGLLVEMCHKIN
jgi:hypothetical protein